MPFCITYISLQKIEYLDFVLALTIVDIASTAGPSVTLESGTAGWELALVTATSSSETAATSSKLVLGDLIFIRINTINHLFIPSMLKHTKKV